jgi:hypothetical protein
MLRFVLACALSLPASGASAQSYPFVYLGQGDTDQEAWNTVWIWFRSEAPQRALAALIDEAPLPLAVVAARDAPYFRAFGPSALRVNSDDFFRDYVRLTYNPAFRKKVRLDERDATRRYFKVHEAVEKIFEKGGVDHEPTGAEWTAYNADVDRWLAAVHARHPIAFALKTGHFRDRPSPWHAWSASRAGSDVLPLLTAFFIAARPELLKLTPEQAEERFAPRAASLLQQVLGWLARDDAGLLDAATRDAALEAFRAAEGLPGNQRIDAESRALVAALSSKRP